MFCICSRDRQRQLRKWQKQFGKQQEQQKKVSYNLMPLDAMHYVQCSSGITVVIIVVHL